MLKSTSGFLARAHWLAPAAALSMLGCPKQELAPLGPCTVSAVREDVNQTGISDVDLLFVIDNSRSMEQEQKNIAEQLPRLVKVLTSGDKYAGREAEAEGVSDDDRYFPPVTSLHLGVISSELGGIRGDDPLPGLLKGLEGCLDQYSDDARLLTSTEIATAGKQFDANGTQVLDLEPDTYCDSFESPKYQEFAVEDKTPEQIVSEAEDVAHKFSCVAKLGVLGCAYEQQLEAMWKALAPSSEKDFLGGRSGNGNPDGFNKGFVREEAILAVLHVTDEEDCSITEEGRALFEGTGEWSNRMEHPENLRCGQADADGRDELIHSVDRYIDGLKSLKPDHQDRIIFGGLVGIEERLEQRLEMGQYDDVLDEPSMQFEALPSDPNFPQPSCFVNRGAGDEEAYPPRRFVQVAKGFGPDNSALYSICRLDYGPAVDAIIDKIASKLSGNCLPRRLNPDTNGLVRCEVFEILPKDKNSCDTSKGRQSTVERRQIRTADGKLETRNACKINQVAVNDGNPGEGRGWYYDDFSPELKDECNPGEQQRIIFTQGAELESGSGATFECFQPVASINVNARGFDAVNTRCESDDDCEPRSDDDYTLICPTESTPTCQIQCRADPDCPPGWVCATGGAGTADGDKYCQQPTCPTDDSVSAAPTGEEEG